MEKVDLGADLNLGILAVTLKTKHSVQGDSKVHRIRAVLLSIEETIASGHFIVSFI